jgi:hypothetical protein
MIFSRFITTIFVLALFSCSPKTHITSYVEKSKSTVLHPFEVIYADGAYSLAGNKPLKTYDFLNWDDTVQLKGGTLLLAHYSGSFFEFQGDTNINIEPFNLKAGYEKPGYHFDNHDGVSGDSRPTLKHLFETDQHHEIYDANMPFLQFSHPQPSNVKVGPAQEVCLRWWTRNPNSQSNEYQLSILNEASEPLGTKIVKGNTYKLNVRQYAKSGESNRFQLTVRELGEGLKSANSMTIIIDKPNRALVDICDIKTAITALETAYHLEYQGDTYGALSMHELAASLSDQSIYNELLANFKNRYGLE